MRVGMPCHECVLVCVCVPACLSMALCACVRSMINCNKTLMIQPEPRQPRQLGKAKTRTNMINGTLYCLHYEIFLKLKYY